MRTAARPSIGWPNAFPSAFKSKRCSFFLAILNQQRAQAYTLQLGDVVRGICRWRALAANGERPRVVREVSVVGRWVLVLAFGAILGSLATTFYAALIDRLVFLVGIVEELAGF